MDAVAQRDPAIPLQRACRALGLPRASVYRRLRPKPPSPTPRRPHTSARALSDAERRQVLEFLHTERFIDQPPREVYATLLAC